VSLPPNLTVFALRGQLAAPWLVSICFAALIASRCVSWRVEAYQHHSACSPLAVWVFWKQLDRALFQP